MRYESNETNRRKSGNEYIESVRASEIEKRAEEVYVTKPTGKTESTAFAGGSRG